MKSDEKKCPACAEIIKKEALVCRYCGNTFSAEMVAAQKAKDAKGNFSAGFLVVLIGIAALGLCTSKPDPAQKAADDKQAAQEAEKEQAKAVENKRNGFHCLSAWDGSHRGIVATLKKGII